MLLGTDSIGKTLMANMLVVVAAISSPALAQTGGERKDGERDWQAEFQKLYGLKDGEVLRRIAPPYPECREKLFDEKSKAKPPAFHLDTNQAYLFFHFQKNKANLGTSHSYGPPVPFPPPGRLSFVLERGLRFPLSQVEAPGELLDASIDGEFVFRAGTPPEKWAPALDRILRIECKMPVKVTLREVERDVLVLSGAFQSKPREGQKKNTIVLSAGAPAEDWSGSGIGKFDEFVQFLNDYLAKQIVSEVARPPQDQLWWRHPSGTTMSILGRTVYTEYPNAEATLTHVAAQTGLTFKAEKRKVRVLFLEQ